MAGIGLLRECLKQNGFDYYKIGDKFKRLTKENFLQK